MPFPILLTVAASQIHNAILPIQNCFTRALVFTTPDFFKLGKQIRNDRHGNKAFRPQKQLIRDPNPLKIFLASPKLRKLG
jgi:hypothetical protein